MSSIFCNQCNHERKNHSAKELIYSFEELMHIKLNSHKICEHKYFYSQLKFKTALSCKTITSFCQIYVLLYSFFMFCCILFLQTQPAKSSTPAKICVTDIFAVFVLSMQYRPNTNKIMIKPTTINPLAIFILSTIIYKQNIS